MQITTYDHQSGTASIQDVNLRRVTGGLFEATMRFFSKRGVGGTFYAEELRSFIAHSGLVCAPNSPCRVMQILKKQGLLNYRVVTRAKSLYEILKTEEKQNGTETQGGADGNRYPEANLAR